MTQYIDDGIIRIQRKLFCIFIICKSRAAKERKKERKTQRRTYVFGFSISYAEHIKD
jgi:hypothetical protein